jgi:hypothetical protein
MKCPACGYTSFPYLERCRKCGQALAEARAIYGAYGLPPTPPDLMSAYEAARADAAESTSPEAVSIPTLDLSELDEIALALTESADASPGPELGGEPPGTGAEATPTFDLDLEPGRDVPPEAPETVRAAADDDLPVPTLDLSELEGLALDLTEVVEDAHINPPERSISPAAPGDVERVIDLDLDEDEPESRTLDSEAKLSRRGDDGHEEDEDSEEYVLEIEDELELEIDELEVEGEEDGEADEDGDDARR